MEHNQKAAYYKFTEEGLEQVYPANNGCVCYPEGVLRPDSVLIRPTFEPISCLMYDSCSAYPNVDLNYTKELYYKSHKREDGAWVYIFVGEVQ